MAARKSSAVRFRLGPLSIYFASLFSSATVHAETELRWKLKEGQKLHLLWEQKVDSTYNTGQTELKSRYKLQLNTTWIVRKVGNDGKAEIARKVERIRFQGEHATEKIDYDSSDEKKPEGVYGRMAARVFTPLVGEEMGFSMDAYGQISEVKVSEKMKKALEEVPGTENSGGLFSAQTWEQVLEPIPAVPKEELSKARTWTAYEKIPHLSGMTWYSGAVQKHAPWGTLHAAQTYKYSGPENKAERKLERLDVKTALSFQKGAVGLPATDFDPKVNSQDGSGVVYFDSMAGRLAQAEFQYKVSLGFTRPVPMELEMDIGIQLKVEEEKQKGGQAEEAK